VSRAIPRPEGAARSRRLSAAGTAFATILLLVAIVAGAFLRLPNIGRYGFWTDELFHVFAAKSYLTDGNMHIPWKTGEYTRALPVTYLTVLSFKLFGESEASARLPFALANLVFIFLAYRIIKDMFSRRVGLIFVISLSLSIFAIQMSQECRMYTLFQLVYFLMSIAFFRGLEPAAMATSMPSRANAATSLPSRPGISRKHLALALGLALVGFLLQLMTFNFIFVVLAYSIVMLVDQGLHEGLRKSILSKYSIILASIGILTLLLALIRPQLLEHIAQAVLQAPTWNRSSRSNFAFYQRVITDSHFIEWAIYPLGAVVAVHRYGRKGLFFVLSFFVLFFMHCFIFAQHSERYIFHLLPFFLAVAAVGLDLVLSSTATFASKSLLTRWPKTLFFCALGASLLLLVVPRIQRTIADTSVPKFSNWKGLDPALIEAVRRGPSLTTERWGFNYYFGEYPDYIIEAAALDNTGPAVLITSLEELETAIALHPDLYLVTYKQQLDHDAFVTAPMREYILRELERVDHEPDIHIMVFRKPRHEEG
jgi:4-amino-4-deoxy-L-arabinose transferase-like glycosyltransferase